jgi:DNA-binding NtrC family response regulator
MKNLPGKIVLVDEKKYEKALLISALLDKNWQVRVEYFSDPAEAFEYLKVTDDELFLILSELNMTRMHGLKLKKKIDKNSYLRRKGIPFIFISSVARTKDILEAYEYRVQGFFEKPETLKEQAELLEKIIRYWIDCRHPNRELSNE